MSGVVFHIGLPKTGTTTLQKAVFPRLAGVAYAGKNFPAHGFATQDLGAAITATVSADTIFGDPAPHLAREIGALREQVGASSLLVSTEALAHPCARDIGVVARRLADAVPDARILITLRAQDSLALSWFRSHGRFAQYLFLHKSESERLPALLDQRAWWNFVQREPRAGLLAMLDFNAVCAAYEQQFGGRVTVLPLELLANDRMAYCARLGSVLEVPAAECSRLLVDAHENRGLSAREVGAAKLLARVGVRMDILEHRERSAVRRFLAAGPRADPTLDQRIASSLTARFAEGNVQLGARHGFDAPGLWPGCAATSRSAP